MAGLFQRIAQNYRKKKKITQPSARLNAKEDKTEHAGKVTRAKERIHSKAVSYTHLTLPTKRIV